MPAPRSPLEAVRGRGKGGQPHASTWRRAGRRRTPRGGQEDAADEVDGEDEDKEHPDAVQGEDHGLVLCRDLLVDAVEQERELVVGPVVASTAGGRGSRPRCGVRACAHVEWSERGPHCLRMCSCFWVRADSRAWRRGGGREGSVLECGVSVRGWNRTASSRSLRWRSSRRAWTSWPGAGGATSSSG